MTEMVGGFKVLVSRYKNVGGKFLKNTAIELFLETYHDDLISRLAEGLSHFKPEDAPHFINGAIALPIPEHFFKYLKGFEDYIDTLPPERLFEWIAEANPLIAAAIMDAGDAGAEYMVKFKQFVADSVRALKVEEVPAQEEKVEEVPATEQVEEEEEAEEVSVPPHHVALASSEESAPPATTPPVVEKPPPRARRKKLTCDKCGHTQYVTKEEAAAIKECPECHEPA